MKLTNRNYGIEIEFLRREYMSNSECFSEIIREARLLGVDVRDPGYTHVTTPYWKVITDSSCGLELVSPILSGEDGFQQIEKICSVLNGLGYKVNKSCGLHVHHDARDLTPEQITGVFATAMKWETVLDQLVAPSRTNNRYCKSLVQTGSAASSALSLNYELNLLRQQGTQYGSIDYDRYLKVNYQAYLRHNTIEFRQHQGTTEADKIIHWIILTQNLVTRVVEVGTSWTVRNPSAISFKRFRDMLGCTGQYIENNPRVLKANKTMQARYHTFSQLDSYASKLV